MLPGYLNVEADQLGAGTGVTVRVLGDMASIARDLAENIRDQIVAKPSATFIIPVGPVDQFPILAKLLNDGGISCVDVMFINMDEYLDENDLNVSPGHALSFAGYMKRAFYNLLKPELAPPSELRVFPDPQNPGCVQELIDERGGVDVCYGGIGINGHMAFNEPPEPGLEMSVEEFGALPTRVLDLSRETKTINSVTVGGEMAVIPKRAVTVGMKEILESRKLRFYCNRPWQSAVIRRLLHGPITAACPSSLMRKHPDAVLTVADYVAAKPDIRLR